MFAAGDERVRRSVAVFLFMLGVFIAGGYRSSIASAEVALDVDLGIGTGFIRTRVAVNGQSERFLRSHNARDVI